MTNRLCCALAAASLCLALLVGCTDTGMGRGDAQALGCDILASPGVRQGLYLHLGCGNGRLTAALSKQGTNVVLGLDTRPASVAQARRYINGLGLYGPVSVDRVPFDRLPMVSNSVNLVVAGDVSAVLREGCSVAEIARVLAPRGVALLGNAGREPGLAKALADAGLQAIEAAPLAGNWLRAVKPVPSQTDDWTQFRHDASRAAISADEVVGPTSGFQWIQGDLFGSGEGRTHTILASQGRIFYFMAKRGSKDLEHNCLLVARDGFNGTLLWTRPMYLPADTRLVGIAQGDRVYTHLTATGPVVTLDAATGEVTKTFDVRGELTWHEGDLLVHCQPAEWTALDPASGAVKRRFGVARPPAAYRGPIVIADSLAYLVEGDASAKPGVSSIVCFDYANAKRLWSIPNRGDGTLYACHSGVLLTKALGKNRFTAPGTVRAYDARTGALRWDYPLVEKWGKMTSGMFLDGYYWTYATGNLDPGGRYVGIDPVTKALRLDNGPSKSSNRCNEDMATRRFILSTDMDMVDKSMNVFDCHFARSACVSGYIPANGMLYQCEHQCVCGTFVHGVLGLSCEPVPDLEKLCAAAPQPLEQGPAYGSAKATALSVAADDWPTYRHDASRSGATRAALAATPAIAWVAAVGSEATGPVAAGGKVFVASGTDHSVTALDAASGKRTWRFTAGGRIDSPPTLHAGTVLFGSHDGWVYCLREGDGRLVWRLRAAPQDRRIAVRGQVESVWPVIGAVLVDSGIAYFSAGRHSDADGGLCVCAVQPATGAQVWRKVVQGMPPLRTDPYGAVLEAVVTYKKSRGIEGPRDLATLNDVLVSNGATLFLGGLGVDPRSGEAMIAPAGTALFGGPGTFLYDNATSTNPGRATWSLMGDSQGDDLRMPQSRTIMRGASLAVEGTRVFGVWKGEHKLELFAADFSSTTGSTTSQWVRSFDKDKVVIEGLLVAGDKVVAACAPQAADSSGVRKGAWHVRTFDRETGRDLGTAEAGSGSGPRFDGMAAAGGRLFVSTKDGNLVCLR